MLYVCVWEGVCCVAALNDCKWQTHFMSQGIGMIRFICSMRLYLYSALHGKHNTKTQKAYCTKTASP